MIIASFNGPMFSQAGFGQSTFTKGTNFNCNASICYGIGTANHELLKQLQQAINSFATLARFTPITVDGFIGAGTVNAGAQAARVARGQGAGDSPLLAQLASGMTKEQIATNAPGLLSALTTANSALVNQGAPIQALAPTAAAPAAAPEAPAPTQSSVSKAVDFVKSFFQPSASPTPGGFGPAPTTPGAPAVPGAAPTTAAAAAAAPAKKVPTWVWIFAGVAGVAIIGGVSYAIFHKPEAAPAPAAAKAPAAPAAAKAVGRRVRRRRRRVTG